MRLQNIDLKNFGDDLNPILINKITGKKVIWKNPASQNFISRQFNTINFAIGSILHFAKNNCNIWGSGLIDSKSNFPLKAKYYALRGPNTYRILKQRGCKVNNIYGDPALLLPRYFPINTSKKYSLGIIPHYTEVENFMKKIEKETNEINVIDLRKDPLDIINDIQSCEKILSSSLHGIIVAMAYGIPVLRIKISDEIYGDGIKYDDFYNSVNIQNHNIYNININNLNLRHLMELFKYNNNEMYLRVDLEKMQNNLLSVIPF
ncbi:MAG: polysaccharide pyruvyl transferase family protein [Clostridia bacterium]|nr:polysaccharide pyruvyl transferase family protein [Clostridia bacterium]